MTLLRPFNNFDYTSYDNPAVDTNPPSVAMTWCNLTTGEVFICTDNAVDDNTWINSLGKVISSLPASLFKQSKHVTTFSDSTLSGIAISNFGSTTDNGVTSFIRANGQYISLKPSVPNSTTFSVSAWINLTSLGNAGDGSASRRAIFYEGTTSHKIGFSVYDDGCSLFGIYTDQYYEILNTTVKVVTDSLYHIAGVRDGTSLYLYLNGILVGTQTCPATELVSFEECYVGRQTAGRDFDGTITNLQLYTNALTQTQITKLFNLGVY